MIRTYLEREELQDELDQQVVYQVTSDRHHGDGSRLHPLTSLRRIPNQTHTRMLAPNPLSYVIGHMNIYLFLNNTILLKMMASACMITLLS